MAWAVALLALGAVWVFAPDEAAVRAAFDRLGPVAPAAFVALEIAQVVIAPIPGQPIEIPGGWFFGLVPGAVLGTIGAVLGSLAAFGLARRYGRPWVHARITPRTRARIDKHLGREDRAAWIVFLLMLVPSFPRDPLCYAAGLTDLSWTRFAFIAVVGRPIGLAPWVALGAEGLEVGIEVQLWMAGVAGAIWLAHRGAVWVGRRAANQP